MDVAVRPGRLVGRICVPGSKSIAQRALILASHKGGTIRNVPDSDDIDRLCSGLRALGYNVEERPGERTISGELSNEPAMVFVGENGTAARCLTAMAALRPTRTVIDGESSLRRRPIQPLCEALRELGAEVEGDEFPITVRGPIEGGSIKVSTQLTSQFATALILLVDRVKGLRISVIGDRSIAYVGLTAHVKRQFCDPYVVEADFSSAAPFAVGAAITGGDLLIENLSLSSPQPDARLYPYLNRAGATVTEEDDGIRVRGGPLTGITADLSDSPDLAPLIGVLGACADGTTRVEGAPHLVHKESDRIEQTVSMIRRLGGEATAHEDGFSVSGGRPLTGRPISCANDHRIAMAAAVLALWVPGVTVLGAEAVEKSYPRFFEDLSSLTE